MNKWRYDQINEQVTDKNEQNNNEQMKKTSNIWMKDESIDKLMNKLVNRTTNKMNEQMTQQHESIPMNEQINQLTN